MHEVISLSPVCQVLRRAAAFRTGPGPSLAGFRIRVGPRTRTSRALAALPVRWRPNSSDSGDISAKKSIGGSNQVTTMARWEAFFPSVEALKTQFVVSRHPKLFWLFDKIVNLVKQIWCSKFGSISTSKSEAITRVWTFWIYWKKNFSPNSAGLSHEIAVSCHSFIRFNSI